MKSVEVFFDLSLETFNQMGIVGRKINELKKRVRTFASNKNIELPLNAKKDAPNLSKSSFGTPIIENCVNNVTLGDGQTIINRTKASAVMPPQSHPVDLSRVKVSVASSITNKGGNI